MLVVYVADSTFELGLLLFEGLPVCQPELRVDIQSSLPLLRHL